MHSPLTPEDERWLAEHSNCTLRDLVGVAARDEAGQPAVVVCHPLQQRGQRLVPFPTTFWLVQPELDRQLACLERQGVIAQLQQCVDEDEQLQQAMHDDAKRYAAYRWQLLDDAQRDQASRAGYADVLRDTGVGGSNNPLAVKCLHAQYAFHLAEGSALGKLIDARLTKMG